jgi:hypothetical protein
MQILTMNGLSKTTLIAFTEDQQTAIMVPPTVNLSDSLGWNATTLGVKSTCTVVTSQCIDMQNLGPNAGLMTNCPASVNFNTTALLTDICNSYGANFYGGPLGPAGVPLNCTENPNATWVLSRIIPFAPDAVTVSFAGEPKSSQPPTTSIII